MMTGTTVSIVMDTADDIALGEVDRVVQVADFDVLIAQHLPGGDRVRHRRRASRWRW